MNNTDQVFERKSESYNFLIKCVFVAMIEILLEE